LKGKKGETLYESEVRTAGRANVAWMKMHGLTKNSAPNEWFKAVLPIKKKLGHSKLHGHISVDYLCHQP
jgi:hypothetical protein